FSYLFELAEGFDWRGVGEIAGRRARLKAAAMAPPLRGGLPTPDPRDEVHERRFGLSRHDVVCFELFPLIKSLL
ncbi:MAG TPA: hypothetical protein VIC84_18155, partial [Blastocatellia bacterium]